MTRISSREAGGLGSGQNGADLITNADGLVEGVYIAVLFLEDDSQLHGNCTVSRGDVPTTATFSSQFLLPLPFTAIQLAAGSCLAYKG